MLLRRWIAHVREQNWLAVALDLAVVIIGVFIGFQLSEWNAQRKDAGLARSYLERLIADVDAGIASSDFALAQAARKREGLERIRAAMRAYAGSGRFDGDPDELKIDIVRSTMFTWTSGDYRTPTFDEMTATGALTLIESPAMRALITEFYWQFDAQGGRAQTRRTGYGNALFRVVPAELMGADQLVSDEEIVAFASEVDVEDILAGLRDGGLEPYVNAELAFTIFLEREFRGNQSVSIQFEEALEAYLATGEVRSVSWRLPG